MRLAIRLLPILLATASGCGPGYGQGQRFAPRCLADRTLWSASGTLEQPAAAIDGTPSTAAVAPTAGGPRQLTIDLGEPCLFNMIVIDHGDDEFGFCRSVALQTSADGRKFDQHAVVPGNRKVTVICNVTPVLARYVRLKAVVPGDRPWSIAEVYLQ